jgi:hypothetical protein
MQTKAPPSAPLEPPANPVYFWLCFASAVAYFALSDGVRGYVTFMLQSVQKIAGKLA